MLKLMPPLPPHLQYSSYTASRMQTWTEKGRSNVKLLMAKMSVPNDQSSANFSGLGRMLMGVDGLSHEVFAIPYQG